MRTDARGLVRPASTGSGNRAIGAPQIVKRSDDAFGFAVLPRRWVVERTFAWLGRYRRMSKDYEELPQRSECMILIAMTNLMSRRLARCRT